MEADHIDPWHEGEKKQPQKIARCYVKNAIEENRESKIKKVCPTLFLQLNSSYRNKRGIGKR